MRDAFAGFGLIRSLLRVLWMGLFFFWLWLIPCVEVLDGIRMCHDRYRVSDPFGHVAWLAVLGLALCTCLLTAALRLALDRWPRVAVVALLPPVISFGLSIAVAWSIPAHQPRAGVAALDLEIALASLYIATITRSWWRRCRRDVGLPTATVRGRARSASGPPADR